MSIRPTASRVREAVTRFVDDQMRDDDTAVVLKPLDPLTTIRLTADRDGAARGHRLVRGAQGTASSRVRRSRKKRWDARRRSSTRDARRSCCRRLRALATQLGSSPGRSAILLVSEGFTRQPRRLTARGLPDPGSSNGSRIATTCRSTRSIRATRTGEPDAGAATSRPVRLGDRRDARARRRSRGQPRARGAGDRQRLHAHLPARACRRRTLPSGRGISVVRRQCRSAQPRRLRVRAVRRDAAPRARAPRTRAPSSRRACFAEVRCRSLVRRDAGERDRRPCRRHLGAGPHADRARDNPARRASS